MKPLGIGEKIKHIRELRNYTQDFMADMLGVSQSTYARYEKEDSELSFSRLQKIAEVLDVKVEDLINFSEKYVFNNFTSHQSTQGYTHTVNYHFSENERKLYEDKIRLLEEKIAWLEKNK